MYIEGMLIPVPRKKIKSYIKLAKIFGRVWLDCGALQVVENQGDDVKKGKITSFPHAVKLKAGEVVFFSYVVFKSKSHRNSAHKKLMKDPRVQSMKPEDWPFDGMRMIFGGFKNSVFMSSKK